MSEIRSYFSVVDISASPADTTDVSKRLTNIKVVFLFILYNLLKSYINCWCNQDFGCNILLADYDGDGELELVYDELHGLVGAEITVEGHLQSSGWMSIFTINGEIYRETGQPIWASQHQWRLRNRNGPKGP